MIGKTDDLGAKVVELPGQLTNRRSCGSRTTNSLELVSWRIVSPMNWDEKEVALLKKLWGVDRARGRSRSVSGVAVMRCAAG